jgi:hypothetical protein
VDRQGVASGTLSNGFMHGQLNTTFALVQPWRRAEVATQRMVDWPLDCRGLNEPRIVFDPERCVPIVPAEASRAVRTGWSCLRGVRADSFVRRCLEHARGVEPISPAEGCSSTADLVNTGAAFYEAFNVELAASAWRAAAAVPAKGGLKDDIVMAARDNLGILVSKRRKTFALYTKARVTNPVV